MDLKNKRKKTTTTAKKVSDKRDDKLGEDTLKSSGTKYSGNPCKEN